MVSRLVKVTSFAQITRGTQLGLNFSDVNKRTVNGTAHIILVNFPFGAVEFCNILSAWGNYEIQCIKENVVVC